MTKMILKKWLALNITIDDFKKVEFQIYIVSLT